jgi:hypothetical protein
MPPGMKTSGEMCKTGNSTETQWLALLLCARKIPGSNLGPQTSYSDWGFLSPSKQISGHDSHLSYPLKSLIILSFDAFELLRPSLNKQQINKRK